MDWNQCGVWGGSVFFIGIKSEAISRYPLNPYYALKLRNEDQNNNKISYFTD